MQIQSIMAGLAGESKFLQSKVLAAMRNIFKVAQENGLVARSPVSSTLKTTPEKEPLTKEESLILLNKVQNARARTFLLIALHTGMRRGEIFLPEHVEADRAGAAGYARHRAHFEAHLHYQTLRGRSGHQGDPVSGGTQHHRHDAEGLYPL